MSVSECEASLSIMSRRLRLRFILDYPTRFKEGLFQIFIYTHNFFTGNSQALSKDQGALIGYAHISLIVCISAFLPSNVAPNRLHSELHLSLMATVTVGQIRLE